MSLGCFARTQRCGETWLRHSSAVTLRQRREILLPLKRIQFAAVVVGALLWAGCGSPVQSSGQNRGAAGDDNQIGRAFKNRTSNVQVEGEGSVTRILADDLAGSRHQRFVVRLASGQTVLIAHNIDIALRVAGLQETIAYASTVSTCGTKREAWSTGRTTQSGGMWQVG